MNCMKCGRETVGDEVFCADCLAEMERYPVRPGTVIHLPHRQEDPAPKKAPTRRKAAPPAEEQVKNLKKQVRKLRFVLLFLVLLMAATCYFAIEHIKNSDLAILPGQNYTSVTGTVSGE